MKKSVWVIAFVFSNLLGFTAVLSDSAKISLLTATPGQELYTAFGHSALWVYDPVYGIDEVYNYGTFDFEAKNFYLNFVMGKLNYKLEVTSLDDFLFVYSIEGRGIKEQVINLAMGEMQVIYDFLLWNRKPENQYYLYDFFFDNCATRIRDLIDKLLSINWGAGSYAVPKLTFRQLIKPYLEPSPWARFGIDLVLGLSADRLATNWEVMFLPDFMFDAFESARHADGRPLLAETRSLLPQTDAPMRTTLILPILVGWLIFILGFISFSRIRFARLFDMIFFTALGVAGVIIMFLWFLSDHTATNLNLNLLWAIPFHLYFIYKSYLLFPIGIPRYYFKVVFLLNLMVIVLWPLMPQTFHPGFFPLILLSAIKSFPYAFGDVWKKILVLEKYMLTR